MVKSRRIKLIANPVSGGDARARIGRLQRCLSRRGAEVETFLTQKRGDAVAAAATARQGDYALVVAAGGDGTLAEVIAGLVPSATPLAFVPLGTTNVFALEAGIPFDLEAACDIALDGEPRAVCYGRAGDAVFLLMAGVGFDGEVVRRVSTKLKRRVGKLAYLVSALDTLVRWRPPRIEVECGDGKARSGFGLIVGNARLYGGRFSVTPGASLEAPDFDVCLFCRGGRLDLLRYGLGIALGRPLGGVERFRARSLTVKGEGVPVQLDGDFHACLPMEFQVVSGELTLVFPSSAALSPQRRMP